MAFYGKKGFNCALVVVGGGANFRAGDFFFNKKREKQTNKLGNLLHGNIANHSVCEV